MNEPDPQSNAAPRQPGAALRWSVYGLLIAAALGSMFGRILAVDSIDVRGLEKSLKQQGREDWRKSRPFLSANDRSRWATVRSLVELGTYEIDDIVSQPGWDTIDMVKHVGRDGQPHLYSSKPPLMATLMAGEYWLIHKLTGTTLGTHPYEIGRFMLVTCNLLPLALYFMVLAWLAERLGTTDWGRLFLMTAATWATYLSTFVITINNHLPAAVSAAIALYAVVRIVYDDRRELRYFFLAGVFAALTAALELPALLLLAVVAGALLLKFPRPTLLAFAPAALVVAAGHFATNYIAHDSLREPYAHRKPGDDWYHYTFMRGGKERQSYWNDPQGIDRGEPSQGAYGLHVLVGHHGVFSLTPVWLLTVAGLAISLWRGPRRELAALVAGVSLACFAFYLSLGQVDRNFGGMTSGLRWMFWFAPLWLVGLLPAADRLAARRWGRGFALVLLALSAMSAAYPTWNPWTHPWLTNYLVDLGWIKFP